MCPVCGYRGLEEPAYDEFNCSSYEICPSCGTQFGYSDAGFSHEHLRYRWIENGCEWFSSSYSKPEGWSAKIQLEEANFIS
jgi:hypothetical protein